MSLLSTLKQTFLPGLIAASLLLAMPASSVLASPSCPDGKTPIGRSGKTAFVDISILGRKKRAASKMTKLHKKMAKKGWSVVNVAPYVENGDLQGFFVTYVREPNSANTQCVSAD